MPNSCREYGKIRAFPERKRIVRLLIDDVTLIKARTHHRSCPLVGRRHTNVDLERPKPIAQIRKFKPELVALVDQLLDEHCDREIADILNRRGWRTWEGKRFSQRTIAFLREYHNLSSHHARLHRRGLLTTRELAARYQITDSTVREWGRLGLIKNHYADSHISALWEIPAGYIIAKARPGGQGAPHLVPTTVNQTNGA